MKTSEFRTNIKIFPKVLLKNTEGFDLGFQNWKNIWKKLDFTSLWPPAKDIRQNSTKKEFLDGKTGCRKGLNENIYLVLFFLWLRFDSLLMYI